ncbi:ABC transporter ATP-binding protein [Acetobacter thailandicus]|uniref:ABC transporter ATP-binding protein n=2 Tax=Acetobacteraceae TaxID=433 RepID=A0ABT3QF88_9PROT|nr:MULTISPECIES: ABC transporter ATP-binding protein [Acetobacter]MCX2563949.1 ABC transporter ATP-binding protein [Acetobacter thailandicus]
MAGMNDDLVASLDNIGLSYDQGAHFILRNVTLSLRRGEFVALLGPSGVGKSTLLRVVMGLTVPLEGAVHEVSAAPDPRRRKNALVFQDARLIPWRSVAANVAFGLEGLALTRQEKQDRIESALRLVGLTAEADRWPRKLSGGQRQRVGVARALTVDPDLLLMDEPFGALDPITRHTLQDELLKIWEQTHKTILFVTHDIEEALKLATRIVVLAGAPAKIAGCLNVTAEMKEAESVPFKQAVLQLRSMIAGVSVNTAR